MAKSKNTPYSKGKRWGYAVARAEISTGKGGVHKVDKAMKTCAKMLGMVPRSLIQMNARHIAALPTVCMMR